MDLLERMKDLGVTTLEMLSERLEAEPEKWSNREIMELAKILIAPTQEKASAGAGKISPVSFNVNFVTPKAEPGAGAGLIIEG